MIALGVRLRSVSWLRALPWVALVVAVLVVELGLRAPDAMSVDAPGPAFASSAIGELRAAPLQAIDDPTAAAIVSGVTFGRTEQITPADQQLFVDSGLWHLLAASGQNIALVATCCALLMRALGRTRVAGGVLALAAIPAYVFVVGGGASIVRAGIMGELAVVAWLAGVLADMRHVVVLSAAAICWGWPGAHRGLGMQLSYACVIGLAWWAGPMTEAITRRGVPTWLAAGCAATVICSLATAPVLVLRTGASPVTGTVANLLAVPLAGGVLVVGLAASLIATFGPARAGPLADVGFTVAGWAASLLHALAERAATLPLAQSSSRLLSIGLPVALLAWWLVRRSARWQHRPRAQGLVVRGLAVTCACCALGGVASQGSVSVPGLGGGSAPPIGDGVMRIGVLDIGQGDATLVATNQGAVLIDVGPPDGEVVRRVRALGVDRVDGIVLTHDSLDHRGGYDLALAGLRPTWVAKARGSAGTWKHVEATAPRLVDLCAGSVLRIPPDVTLRVEHPTCDGHVTPRTSDLHNDGAMVTLVEHGAVRALVPADAEAPVLRRLPLPRLDLLRISHHGSSDPDLPALLELVHPQLAAISAGEGNDYGHPRRDVLDALERAGVQVFRTDLDGSIAFDSDGTGIVVR